MTYQEALAQLRNHANLAEGEDDASLLYGLSRAEREGQRSWLSPFVEDILACLVVANLELNGPRPSETGDRYNPTVIADLAYPVTGLVVDLLLRHRQWSVSGRFPTAVLEAVRDAALRIGLAWDMVLAGDHDDLQSELDIEWNAVL